MNCKGTYFWGYKQIKFFLQKIIEKAYCFIRNSAVKNDLTKAHEIFGLHTNE